MTRVLKHTRVDTDRFTLAAVPFTELSTREWSEVVTALQAFDAGVSEADYQASTALGPRTDYPTLLRDFAETQGWRSLDSCILVALDQ